MSFLGKLGKCLTLIGIVYFVVFFFSFYNGQVESLDDLKLLPRIVLGLFPFSIICWIVGSVFKKTETDKQKETEKEIETLKQELKEAKDKNKIVI
jgi:cell shape-determining protein MreC